MPRRRNQEKTRAKLAQLASEAQHSKKRGIIPISPVSLPTKNPFKRLWNWMRRKKMSERKAK